MKLGEGTQKVLKKWEKYKYVLLVALCLHHFFSPLLDPDLGNLRPGELGHGGHG